MSFPESIFSQILSEPVYISHKEACICVDRFIDEFLKKLTQPYTPEDIKKS